MKEVLKVIDVQLEDIKPYPNNPRRNDAAVDAVAESIKNFGVLVPIVLDKNNVIVAGHTRYKAFKKLGWESVPCVMADGLTDEQVRAFRLVDNKTAEMSEWEPELLAAELENVDWKKLDPEPPKAKEEAPAAAPAPGTGVCKVERSKLARPGALASGTVTFGSGATAEWILDQTGRLGLDKLVGEPTEEDFQAFQTELKKLFANGL